MSDDLKNVHQDLKFQIIESISLGGCRGLILHGFGLIKFEEIHYGSE